MIEPVSIKLNSKTISGFQIVRGSSWEDACNKLSDYNAKVLIPRILPWLESQTLPNGVQTNVSGGGLIDPSTIIVSNYASYKNYTIFYQDGNLWICSSANHQAIVIGY